MGEVWTARRSALGGAAKLVAVKTLLPEKASDRKARSMFLEEARLSMLLTNSNIVQVFDAGETSDGTCYIVMELVDGVDLSILRNHIEARGGLLSHSVIAHIVGEILKALTYAHEFGSGELQRTIVHRDVSPQNVMLSVSGEVKLMDFGVARLASEETSGLFVKGKIRYMPPEQIRGQSRAPIVDLFAVGAILYELLECKKFRDSAKDESELLAMCVNGDVPELTRPGVPDVFKRLYHGLRAHNVEDRIPSAREAHRLLCRWGGDRDAKFELEELVRPLASGARLLPANSSEARTVPRINRKPPVETPAETQVEAPMVNVGETDPDAETKIEAAIVAAPRLTRSPAYRLLAIATMAIGVGGAVAWKMTHARDYEPERSEPDVIAYAPEKPGPTEDPLEVPTSLEPERAKPAKIEPVPAKAEPVPAKIEPVLAKVEPVPAKIEPVPVKAEPVPAKIEPVAAKIEAVTTKVATKPTARTKVAIVAPGVWAQVRINKIVYDVDRNNPIPVRLKPGEYAIYFRDDLDVEFRWAGDVEIPESKLVKLTISADRIASITRLN
jgi:serine/threonine protein kinase